MIRPIEAHDIEAWTAMRGRLWPYADAGDLLREAHAFFAGDPGTIVDAAFLALDDAGDPRGFIELSIRDFADGCDSAPIPHIEGWYVEPPARGRGLGANLMHAAEAWSRERGFVELASDTEVENIASRGAHAACGFEETERLVKFRKEL